MRNRGTYTDRCDKQSIDVKNAVWICASNLSADLILAFFQERIDDQSKKVTMSVP